MSLQVAYHATALLVAAGLAVKALETLYLLPEYGRGRILDYAYAGDDGPRSPLARGVYDRVYSQAGVRFLAILTMAAGATIALAPYGTGVYLAALVVLGAADYALHARQVFGLDGADQMSLLIVLTLVLCSVLASDPGVQRLGLWFIAIQLSLAYLVSGIAKLLSAEWRRGVALRGILSTYTYGTPFFRRLLLRHPTVSLLGCWAVMLTEVALPIGLFAGVPGALVVMAVGMTMHLGIAVVMGLNDFVWSFLAAYPAFLYVAARGFT